MEAGIRCYGRGGKEVRETSRDNCVPGTVGGHSASLPFFVFSGSLPNRMPTHPTPGAMNDMPPRASGMCHVLNAPWIRKALPPGNRSHLYLFFFFFWSVVLSFSRLCQSSPLSVPLSPCPQVLCLGHLHFSSQPEQWVSLVSSFSCCWESVWVSSQRAAVRS